MYHNRTVRVWSAWDKLPCSQDWMLCSFSPLQVEESMIRAKLATDAPHHHGGEVVLMGPMEADAFTIHSQSLNGDRSYLITIASPVISHPICAPYRNQGLSLHLSPRTHYNPHTIQKELQFALHRFLNSSDAIIKPPDMDDPADMSGLRTARFPIRMFVVQLEDVCCPSSSDKICDLTLQAVKQLYANLPEFPRFPYTASIYVATTQHPGFLDLACIGYQKRVFMMVTPRAFQFQ